MRQFHRMTHNELPDPLIPANGFSWSKQASPRWRWMVVMMDGGSDDDKDNGNIVCDNCAEDNNSYHV